MEARDRFRLMTAVALVDARLEQEEQKVLLRAAKSMGLPKAEAEGIIRDMLQGGRLTNMVPPSEPGERRELFDDLVRVALADGVVSAQERACLARLAPSFGIDAGELAQLLDPPSLPEVAPAAPPPLPPVPVAASPPKRATTKAKKTAKTGEAGCPSCGAPIEFKNARSVAAVCAHCDTTVSRTDRSSALQDLGQISHVVPDASPIQLGSSGKCFGVEFLVIGRLQVQHAIGFWNEWYLQWADKRTGWLGEALGQYMVTFPTSEEEAAAQLPTWEQVMPGQRVMLAKKPYVITDKRVARATGTEGETPFAIGDGYELPYADLRRADAGFATLDYSDDKPLAFLGRCVPWKDLNLRNHRTFHGW
jgi:hypothetical protein